MTGKFINAFNASLKEACKMISFEEWLSTLDISKEEFERLSEFIKEELRTEYKCEFPEAFHQQK